MIIPFDPLILIEFHVEEYKGIIARKHFINS